MPPLQNHPYFLGVPITNDIDVDVAARLAGVSLEEFQSLNPQMNKPVILAAGTPQVLLPYDNATLFVRNLRAHRAPLATWTAWVAPKTLKPADAAQQVGMSEADLRAVNRIPPRMLVKAGSTLLVPRSPNTSDRRVGADRRQRQHRAGARAGAASHQFQGRPQGRFGGRGGQALRVSAAQVAEWNSVSSSARFAPGQTVVVMKVQTTQQHQAQRIEAVQAQHRQGAGQAQHGQQVQEQIGADSGRRQGRREAVAARLSAGRPARERWCSGPRIRVRCRPARRAPAA